MEEAACGMVRSEGDLFLNGAVAGLPIEVEETKSKLVYEADEYYHQWSVELPNENLKRSLQVCAGWQAIARPEDVRG